MGTADRTASAAGMGTASPSRAAWCTTPRDVASHFVDDSLGPVRPDLGLAQVGKGERSWTIGGAILLHVGRDARGCYRALRERRCHCSTTEGIACGQPGANTHCGIYPDVSGAAHPRADAATVEHRPTTGDRSTRATTVDNRSSRTAASVNDLTARSSAAATSAAGS